MIDLKAARADPETYRAALARRGAAEELDRLLEVDAQARGIQPRVEELRSRRKLKGKPTPEQLAELGDGEGRAPAARGRAGRVPGRAATSCST